MSKIVAILKDVSVLIVGQVVEDTTEFYRLKNPALAIARSPQPGSFQTDFIPYEMQSIEPQPLPLRAMCDEKYEPVFTFEKKSLVMDNVPLRSDILQGYQTKFVAQLPPTPETNIVKLF